MPSPTPNKGFSYPPNGSDVNTWDSLVLNPNYDDLDTALAGVGTVNVVGASGINLLTRAQYLPSWIACVGALTANVQYNLPANVCWNGVIANFTSGAFTLTIGSATGGGGTVTIPQGYLATVVCNGASVWFGDTRPVPAAGNPGWVQFNAGGVLGASTNLNWDNGNNALNLTGFFWQNGKYGLTGPSNDYALTVQCPANAGRHPFALTDSTGNNWFKGGYLNVPYGGNGGWNGSNYTTVLSDAGKTIGMSSSSVLTAAIASNAAVPYDLTTTITFFNAGSANLNITCGDTMYIAATSTGGTRTLIPNGIATAMKMNTTFWIISGTGLS